MKIIGIVPRLGYDNDQYMLLATGGEIATLVGHTYSSESEVRALLKVGTEIPVQAIAESIAKTTGTKSELAKLPTTLRAFADILEQSIPPAIATKE